VRKFRWLPSQKASEHSSFTHHRRKRQWHARIRQCAYFLKKTSDKKYTSSIKSLNILRVISNKYQVLEDVADIVKGLCIAQLDFSIYFFPYTYEHLTL
jgi:hypothetical protein